MGLRRRPRGRSADFRTFADAGGTFIDTAASYQVGEAEENLGRLLDGRRDDFTVATKFAIGGPDGTGVLQTGNGRRAMFRSVEGSLRRLGTDYIDLLWVHFPDFVTPLDEIVRGLDDLATAGKILYAGLSNFPAWMTARAATLAELRGAIPIRVSNWSTASSNAAPIGRTCPWPSHSASERHCGRRLAVGC